MRGVETPPPSGVGKGGVLATVFARRGVGPGTAAGGTVRASDRAMGTIKEATDTFLLYRIGAPRRNGDRTDQRPYVVVCEHGVTELSMFAISDEEALDGLLPLLRGRRIACDEPTLGSIARARGITIGRPNDLQECELGVHSLAQDYELSFHRTPHLARVEFVRESGLLASVCAWDDPRLPGRFFRATATTQRGSVRRFSMSVQGGATPAVTLRAPEATSPDGRWKFRTRFLAPTPWTRSLFAGLDLGLLPVPGRGREDRGVSPTELNLLAAVNRSLANWLIQRAPSAMVGNVSVAIEEDPLSRLVNARRTSGVC